MKNRRICPKCGNEDIVIVDGFAGPYGSGNNIQAGFTIFSSIPVNRYVCMCCGYSEEWIDQEDLERVRSAKRAHE